MKLTSFHAKTVYVVGASTGIGLAIAKQLAGVGAHVLLFARRETTLQAALKDVEACRQSRDQRLEYRSLDIVDNALTEQVMQAAMSDFGVPWALINCAGRSIPRKVEDVTYQQFDDSMKINLYGCRNTIAALLPAMREKGDGLIINTSSVAGVIGTFGFTDYSASKFALIGYSEALRSELKSSSIHVAVLCPPDTDTPGYQNENLTKPAETFAVSGSTGIMTPEQVATAMFKELPKKRLLIVPGASAKFAVIMKRWFPAVVEWVMDRDIRSVSASSSSYT